MSARARELGRAARPRLSRAAKAGLAAAVVVVLVAAAACTDMTVHPFSAYALGGSGECIEPAGVIDVIDGPDPGECDVLRCWVDPEGQVFITTTACDAPHGFVDHTKDPAGSDCYRALALFDKPGHSQCADSPEAGAN